MFKTLGSRKEWLSSEAAVAQNILLYLVLVSFPRIFFVGGSRLLSSVLLAVKVKAARILGETLYNAELWSLMLHSV